VATYATVDDVVAEYDGTIGDDQIDYIDRKLTSAELMVQAVAGNIGARIGSGRTSFEAVKLVVVNMVIRLLRNPSGLRTQTVGPFSYSLDPQAASARLFVSREDRRLLGLSSGAAGSMSLSDGDDALATLPTRSCRQSEYYRTSWQSGSSW
jgi:hypothetical protein